MTDIHDPDMYLFFEQGVRGGVSTISNKFGQANNPLIPETQSCTLTVITCTEKPCPNPSEKWVDDVANFDVTDVPQYGDFGYVLEVDLEYPQELHDAHSDYPLAPERKKVSDEELSPYSKEPWKKLHPSPKHTDARLHGRVKTKQNTFVIT